jgi:hypothetical protein
MPNRVARVETTLVQAASATLLPRCIPLARKVGERMRSAFVRKESASLSGRKRGAPGSAGIAESCSMRTMSSSIVP